MFLSSLGCSCFSASFCSWSYVSTLRGSPNATGYSRQYICFDVFFSQHTLYYLTIVLNFFLDDFSQDILGTVMGYSTFVDANCLCFLWPIEFNNFRICLISGSVSPMFSCFSIKVPTWITFAFLFFNDGIDWLNRQGVPSANLRDILVFCDGQHFTLMSSYIQTTSVCVAVMLTCCISFFNDVLSWCYCVLICLNPRLCRGSWMMLELQA